MNQEQEPQEHRRADFAEKKGEVVLRKHEYDGIQEFDQKLPNWWLTTFYTAMLIYLIYWFVYYQAGIFKTDQQSVTEALDDIQEERSAALEKTLASLSNEVLVREWATDVSIVAEGEKLYKKVCIACHGANLDAPDKFGLSLVDHDWKYGDDPIDIFNLINKGSPPESTGMPPTGAKMIAWGATNSPKQIAQLVAFIISKNPSDFARFQ